MQIINEILCHTQTIGKIWKSQFRKTSGWDLTYAMDFSFGFIETDTYAETEKPYIKFINLNWDNFPFSWTEDHWDFNRKH